MAATSIIIGYTCFTQSRTSLDLLADKLFVVIKIINFIHNYVQILGFLAEIVNTRESY